MRNPVIQERIQPETAVTFKKYLKNPVFKVISGVADESGTRAFVIGGFVRDLILKRDNKKDIDIVVLGSGIEFANRVASKL